MENTKNYIEFKMKYTDDQIDCRVCETPLTKENFKEKYVCPFDDEPFCDSCFNWGEGQINHKGD